MAINFFRFFRRRKPTVTVKKTAPTISGVKVTDFSSGESVTTRTSTSPSGRTTTTRTASRSGGGSVSSARQQELINATKRLEEQRKQAEIKRKEEIKKKEVLRQAEIKRQDQKRIQDLILKKERQETALVKQFRRDQEQKKKTKFEEDQLRKEIQRLDRARFNVKSKEELDRVVKGKLQKERELRRLQSGVTNYNRKVDVLVKISQNEFNRFIEIEVRRLQIEVDAGNINPSVANKVLENKVNQKQKEINNKLNNNISKIKVPEALMETVGVVQAVEPPKGILRKAIAGLEKIATPKVDRKRTALQESTEGFRELGIGVALGGLSFVRGVLDLPKIVTNFAKNPSLIRNIPASAKKEFEFIGESLKISPTRSVARIGTEIYLMAGTGKVLKILGKASGLAKTKFITQLNKAGILNRLRIKFVGGKIPKIEIKIKSVGESIKQIDTIRNVNSVSRDISKLIPKKVPKAKVVIINKLMKTTISKFLRDKRILLELTRKFPTKTRFTIREIKKIRSYPKLRTAIKRDVFSKLEVKAIRKAKGDLFKKTGRRISGVKVKKKEFKSFQEANKEFIKLKRIGKFVKKIESKGGVGKIESLQKRPIDLKELDVLRVARKIPRVLLTKVKSVSVTTFVQKFSTDVPIIKRFGSLKKGTWRLVLQEKTFYQNSVSFSLFDKINKPLGTITFNTLASKPITRFRSLMNALKWGSNKEVIFSKLTGNSFVRSFVLKARGKKITTREFLSKIKVTSKGEFQDILIFTKKIPKARTRSSLKKQFKRAIPISITKGRITKIKQPAIIKFNKKELVFEIIQRGKTIKKIRTRGIINPVIIDTSVIENTIRAIDKINKKTLSQARLKRLRQGKKLMLSMKKTRSFVVNKKSKVVVSKGKLQQIKKISQETRVLKESLAGRTIPKRIKITRRVEGIKQLKQLKKTDKALRKVRANLIQRKALDIGSKTAIAQALLLSDKLKKALKSEQVIQTAQATRQIQRTIQKSLQRSKSKLVAKTISSLQFIFPILVLIPRARSIRPRLPRTTKKKIIRKRKQNEEEKKFKTFSKPVKIFSVVVKKRGRSIILKNQLTNKDALNFMALELDTQLLRSSVLRPTGRSKKARRLPNKYNRAFEKRKRKLRKFKIKGKKKIPIRGFIEKRKFAVDTRGEKAQLRRAIKKKKIKKRIVRRKPVKKRPNKKRSVKKRK